MERLAVLGMVALLLVNGTLFNLTLAGVWAMVERLTEVMAR